MIGSQELENAVLGHDRPVAPCLPKLLSTEENRCLPIRPIYGPVLTIRQKRNPARAGWPWQIAAGMATSGAG